MPMNLSTLVHHIASAWRRRFALNLFVVFALFASFALLDTALILAKNFEALSQFWGSKVEMNVYLRSNAEDVKGLQAEIERDERVKNVQFISRERAFADLQRQLASHVPELMKDPELMSFIPASLLVELRGAVNPEGYFAKVQNLAEELKQKDQVEDVQYGMGWMSELRTILNVFKQIGLVFFVVVLAGALFMVAFVIRNSIAQRREEIEILELVGASRTFIRFPFLFEGAVISLIAGMGSLVVTNLLFARVKETLMSEDLFVFIAYRLHQFSVAGVIILALLYTGVGVLVSYLCVRNMNTGFAAAEGQGQRT